jgi:signal transduction histidine kinase
MHGEVVGAADATLVVDRGGRVLVAEGPCCDEVAARHGPLVGRSVLDLACGVRFVADDGRGLPGDEAVERALAGESLAGLSFVDGRLFETRVAARRSTDDVTEGACIVALEVTERHRELALALREDRLAALETLAAGVGHEINNPLTYVLMNLDHVAQQLRALAAAEGRTSTCRCELSASADAFLVAVDTALAGAKRIEAVTRDILVFTRGDTERRTLVDVRAVVEATLHVARAEIQRRAQLVRELGDVPLVAASDKALGSVFLHLLANAARAIPEGNADRHRVRVTTSSDDRGFAVVEIADTGTGIAPDVLTRVFDPFFTTRPFGAGRGMGLSISHGIVRHLGGELTVESSVGEGSRFRVLLPPGRRWSGTHERADVSGTSP